MSNIYTVDRTSAVLRMRKRSMQLFQCFHYMNLTVISFSEAQTIQILFASCVINFSFIVKGVICNDNTFYCMLIFPRCSTLNL